MRDLETRIRELPLKEMDGLLLERAIVLEAQAINRVNGEVFHQILNYLSLNHAIQLAAYLHRRQTRANRGNLPRTHYIEHPLRNALRLLRYGCTDQAIIISAILHDTVEDCLPGYMELSGVIQEKAELARPIATVYVLKHFGADVAELVQAVTNPLPDEVTRSQAEKRALYVEHVTEAIKDARVALLKLADFIDNAAGLHHNAVDGNENMIEHLAKKYLPLVDVFIERAKRDDFRALVLSAEHDRIVAQLVNAGLRLRELST